MAQSMCQVDSTNDGNGLFTYTFHRGDQPYVWGLSPDFGVIDMLIYGILEVQDPPGWTHSVSTNSYIRWSVTNGLVFLDDPVTFSVRSFLVETATYDHWPPPGHYPRGIIVAGAYGLPGHTNTFSGGYEVFVFIGPALPTLAIEENNNDILLRWSTLAQGCSLQAADDLSPPAIWTSITNEPLTVGTNFVVILPQTNSAQYFRLVIPAVQIP